MLTSVDRAADRVDVVRRLRGQVGRVAARRAGRDAGRPADAADLLVGLAPFDDAAVYRLVRRRRPRVDHRLLPAARRRPRRLRRHRRRQRVQRRVRHGRPGRARPQRRRLPRAPAGRGGGAPSSPPPPTVVAEAGGVVAGGHTIRSEEPIFGLAVQGLVHPDRVWTKGGARPGDAARAVEADRHRHRAGRRRRRRQGGRHRRHAHAQPRRGRGAGRPRPSRPHAVTDVTGFGLLGHAWEMAERSGAALALDAGRAAALRRRAGRRRGRACAPAATPATGPTSRATCALGAPRGARGPRLRPADLGRPAGRGRTRPTRRRWPPPASSPSAQVVEPAAPASRAAVELDRERPTALGSARPMRLGPRAVPVARASSGRCGPTGTRSSSASTRSAGARGPGPLTVGAAVLPRDRRVYKVRDSKMLTEAERERLFDRIAGWCAAWAVGHASQVGVRRRSACRRPSAWPPGGPSTGLGARRPTHVLVDGKWDFVGGGTRSGSCKGDATLPVDRRRVDPGQGHPRPASCGPRPSTSPATTSTSTRATRAPATRRRSQACGPDVDPPPDVGVHGPPAVGRQAARPGAADPRLLGVSPRPWHRLATQVGLVGVGDVGELAARSARRERPSPRTRTRTAP